MSRVSCLSLGASGDASWRLWAAQDVRTSPRSTTYCAQTFAPPTCPPLPRHKDRQTLLPERPERRNLHRANVTTSMPKLRGKLEGALASPGWPLTPTQAGRKWQGIDRLACK